MPFEPDAALLLCSDGLTDLVDSASIARTVSAVRGRSRAVVRELIAAANAAGGKDNVTVVYVEGEQFAASNYGRGPQSSPARQRRHSRLTAESAGPAMAAAPLARRRRSIVLLVGIAGAFALELWVDP